MINGKQQNKKAEAQVADMNAYRERKLPRGVDMTRRPTDSAEFQDRMKKIREFNSHLIDLAKDYDKQHPYGY